MGRQRRADALPRSLRREHARGASAVCAPKMWVVVVVMTHPPASATSRARRNMAVVLPPPSDQCDDLAGLHNQGVNEPHGAIRRRSALRPAAPRSSKVLAPAWIQGKKLVITARTPSLV